MQGRRPVGVPGAHGGRVGVQRRPHRIDVTELGGEHQRERAGRAQPRHEVVAPDGTGREQWRDAEHRALPGERGVAVEQRAEADVVAGEDGSDDMINRSHEHRLPM